MRTGLFQAFLFPFHQAAAIRRVISVYKHWLQVSAHTMSCVI